MNFINLKDVTYRYPVEKQETLKGINISIEKGEMVLVLGPSGSGKSTLGKVFTGAVPHFYGGILSGQVNMDGEPLKDMDRQKRASKITMVFQDPERQLFMNKVHREMAQGLENLAVEPSDISKRIWEAMEFAGISHLAYRDIASLSGGEKQKVSIAAAIAYQPQCIILDEPISQLDPSATEDILSLIYRINEELGITIIIIEQRVDWRIHKVDRVVFLESGRIKFSGKPEEFYKSDYDIYLSPILRLSKELGMENIPSSFKEIKGEVKKLKYKLIKQEKKDSNENCIVVQNLKVSAAGNEILKGIDTEIKKGEFVSILGANGAGKTTFIKSLCGLNKYSGSIRLFDKEVKRLKGTDIASVVGYVTQNPNDYISKDTVYNEIKFTLDNFNIDEEDKVENIISRLDLKDVLYKNPRDLSGGQKQRVAIASVMVMKPKILILDEPTRGMDPIIKEKLGKILKELNNEGVTIILVTHDMDFSAEYSDKQILMFSGKVVAQGSTEKVMGDNLYYTTAINKIYRGIIDEVFNLSQLERS